MTEVTRSKPKLMELPEDGMAKKPEELDGQDITILNAMQTHTPDGRMTAKWVVRKIDQSVGIYWAAGQNPTLQVQQWFIDNPGMPLFCRLYRQTNKFGTAVWRLEQREEDDELAKGMAKADELDTQLEMAGL